MPEYNIYHSQYTIEQIENSIGKSPIVQNGTWWTWDISTSAYVDSEVPAEGTYAEAADTYAVSSTAAGTAAKVATPSGSFTLSTGAKVSVKFTYANTAASPTLNFGGTGAKAIKAYGTTAAGSGAWVAGQIVQFEYDGTNWLIVGRVPVDPTLSVSGAAADAASVGNALTIKDAELYGILNAAPFLESKIPFDKLPWESGRIGNNGADTTSLGYKTPVFLRFKTSQITIIHASNIAYLAEYSDVGTWVRNIVINNGVYTTVNPDYVYRICTYISTTAYPDLSGMTLVYVSSAVANLTPVATWIDDNQGTPAQMAALSDLLDELTTTTGDRMKVSLSVDCGQLPIRDNYAENLKAFQEAGCHIANHGGTWQDWIDHYAEGADYNPDLCEAAVIRGNVTLSSMGLLETDYFIYPGGHTDTELCARTRKWCKVGVLAGNSDGICHLYGDGRYMLKRCFIREIGAETSAEALTRIKGYIDTAAANHDWIIFGTHSGNSSEFDHDLTVSVIQYVQSKGMPIKTLNDAFKDREWLFLAAEQQGMVI